MVTYWPECYGHVLESIFHLYELYNNIKYLEYKILLCIPFKNLQNLAIFLFKDRFINSLELPQEYLISFKETILIHNYLMTPNFFKFNNDILKNTIRTYYNNDDIKQYKNVFLTRQINSPHDNWSMLENLLEITNFFIKHNFIIIDPQNITDSELYNHIKNAKNIITTNGSALCPLIILNNFNINIFCLNSQRYLPEWRKLCKNEIDVQDIINNNPDILINDNFEKKLWKPITSQFNFTYIDSYENNINEEQLQFIITNLNI